MATTPPDPRRCKRAIKLLEQFERLAQKLGIKLSPARIQHLNVLRDAGAIRSSDLPATMQAKFPGEFAGWTLSAIRKKCARK